MGNAQSRQKPEAPAQREGEDSSFQRAGPSSSGVSSTSSAGESAQTSSASTTVAGPVAANEAEILLLPHLRQAPLPTISRFGNVVERRSAHVSLQDSEPAALITMQAHGHLDRNRT